MYRVVQQERLVQPLLKGVEIMATKSILKTIHIKKRRPALALVRALEHAKGKASKEVVMSRSYSEATESDIRKMFGNDL